MSHTKRPTDVPGSDTKLFAVRLSEAEKRHIKMLAASQGLTLRQAILKAFDVWASQLESGELAADPAWDGFAGADVEKPGKPKRGATPKHIG